MALVTLPMGISRISGRVGNMYFRTMKATGKTYMMSLPGKRTTPPQPSEIEARERFARKARLVNFMRQEGSKLPRKKLWELAEQAL